MAPKRKQVSEVAAEAKEEAPKKARSEGGGASRLIIEHCKQ